MDMIIICSKGIVASQDFKQFTSKSYEAVLFKESFILTNLDKIETILGEKKGKGLSYYEYVPKRFVYGVGNKSFIKEVNYYNQKINAISFSEDINNARLFKEADIPLFTPMISEFLNLELNKGLGCHEVLVSFKN